MANFEKIKKSKKVFTDKEIQKLERKRAKKARQEKINNKRFNKNLLINNY